MTLPLRERQLRLALYVIPFARHLYLPSVHQKT
jgi:hypothetical protein